MLLLIVISQPSMPSPVQASFLNPEMHRSFWLVKFWLVRLPSQGRVTSKRRGVVEMKPVGVASVKV